MKTLFSAALPGGTRGGFGRLVKLARAGRFLGWLDAMALARFSDAASLLVVEEIRGGRLELDMFDTGTRKRM